MYDVDVDFHGSFSELATGAKSAGYTLTIERYEDEKGIWLKLTPDGSKQYTPTITIYPYYSDGRYFWNCKIAFPEIDMKNESYYDACEYYVDRIFHAAARLVTKVQECYYDPDMYEAE